MKEEARQGNTMIHSTGKMVSKQLVWQAPALQLLNQSTVHADSSACDRGNNATYGCLGGVTAGAGICNSGVIVTS